MTIGHRLAAEELSDTSLFELYSKLGNADTPKLYEQPYTVDTDHDISTGAGNSIDRKTKYVDRILYQEVMDGAFKATELTPKQIINRWLDHEHCEICISQGNNGVDVYQPCHNRALRKEHEGVLIILPPRNPAEARKTLLKYESVIWPSIVKCYHRPITKPPKDYWCGPIADHPTERDREILKTLAGLGVVDASKRSKYDAHYGYGENMCRDCSGWNPKLYSQEDGDLAGCHRINGLVRESRWCDMWKERGDA